jgi:hypothetical protein
LRAGLLIPNRNRANLCTAVVITSDNAFGSVGKYLSQAYGITP